MNPKYKVETRAIRHNFTPEEKQDLGYRLAQEFSNKVSILADFEAVKKDYKSKEATADAQIQQLHNSLINGFDIRATECFVVFRPRDKKKDFYLVADLKEKDERPFPYPEMRPVMTLDMDSGDFQQELIQAESKFDKREEIALFPAIEGNYGMLVVGAFAGKWFSALRIKIGKNVLDERLDSEQKAFKFREDAVKAAGKRGLKWFEDNLQEHAKGFEEPIRKALEAQKGRVE